MKWCIKEYINELQIANKTRGNCPVCFRNNTFSITNDGLYTLYYCFHVDCNVKGRIQNDLTLDAIRTSCTGSNMVLNRNVGREELLSSFKGLNDSCISYLKRFNIHNVDLELAYDPKQHRLVFPLNYKGENYGYVGRALDINILPRWYIYLRLEGCPYILENKYSNSVLLVEDCISAIRGMDITNCIALLGTSIPDNVIPYLVEYDRLYLALDPDANSKALVLQKKLSFYKPTTIITLTKDLKYYSLEEIKAIKEEIEENGSARLS